MNRACAVIESCLWRAVTTCFSPHLIGLPGCTVCAILLGLSAIVVFMLKRTQHARSQDPTCAVTLLTRPRPRRADQMEQKQVSRRKRKVHYRDVWLR